MSKLRGWWLLPVVGVSLVVGWLRNRRTAASRPARAREHALPGRGRPCQLTRRDEPEKKGFDPLRPVRAFDRFQERHRSLSIPVAVVKKFGDDGAGDQAALIAYWGFFSLFPLLLVFVTVLGFVLVHHPDAQKAVLDSALKDIPLIGGQIKTHSLKGNGLALAIGIVVTLLSGLAVTLSTQKAFDRVYAIPYKRRANFLASRLRGVVSLAILGALQVISTGASGLVAGGIGGEWLTIAGIALSLLLNVALFAAVFRLLTSHEIHMSEMWPGVLTARRALGVAPACRRGLHRACGEGRERHLRHVRHGDRAAHLAVPRRARGRVLGRAEHGARARAVAAKPARAEDRGRP